MIKSETKEDFLNKYIRSLKDEFMFLSKYYEEFKEQNKKLDIKVINKRFHEKMIRHLEDEDFGQDTYQLLIDYYSMDISLPSFSEIEKTEKSLKEVTEALKIAKSKAKTETKEKKEKISPPPVADPCSRGGYSGSRSGGC